MFPDLERPNIKTIHFFETYSVQFEDGTKNIYKPSEVQNLWNSSLPNVQELSFTSQPKDLDRYSTFQALIDGLTDIAPNLTCLELGFPLEYKISHPTLRQLDMAIDFDEYHQQERLETKSDVNKVSTGETETVHRPFHIMVSECNFLQSLQIEIVGSTPRSVEICLQNLPSLNGLDITSGMYDTNENWTTDSHSVSIQMRDVPSIQHCVVPTGCEIHVS